MVAKLTDFLSAILPIVLGVGTSYGSQAVKWLSSKAKIALTDKRALLVTGVIALFAALILPGVLVINFCLVFAVATFAYHLFVKETLNVSN
jgi:hypothetical protein